MIDEGSLEAKVLVWSESTALRKVRLVHVDIVITIVECSTNCASGHHSSARSRGSLRGSVGEHRED